MCDDGPLRRRGPLAGGGWVCLHVHVSQSACSFRRPWASSAAAAAAPRRHQQPAASPNAGFMRQLIALDQRLHGACSLAGVPLRRGKPHARVCEVCRQQVGVSDASLALHLRLKHGSSAGGDAAPARPAQEGGGAAAQDRPMPGCV